MRHLLFCCLSVLLATAALADAPADLLLVHGRISTMDPARPEAEALAVRGDRIVAVGSSAALATLRGPDTQVIDAAGRRVVPGFIEGHGHFMALGEQLSVLDLRGTHSWEEIVAKVRAAAVLAKPGEWIEGAGWHQEKWPGVPADAVNGVPRNGALDEAAPHNPVILGHGSGHGVMANAAALAAAGIADATPDPAGGQIVRDGPGKATGWLVDTAADLANAALQRARSAKTPAEQRAVQLERIRLAGQEALSKGVTSFNDAGVPFATIDLYRERADAGQLPLRLYVMVGGETNAALEQGLGRYRMVGRANNFLTVRAIKRMVDGALGSHSAWLLEPYADDASTTGLVVDTPAVISRTAEIAIARGFQLNTHAIGDRANREVLDLYGKALAGVPDGKALRWRIEHAQHVHPDDFPRFAALGVIASMQGVHATADGPWVAKRLGEQRARERTYVWRSLMNAGAMIVNGTDAPVEDVDPLAGFRASVTREMADGQRFYPGQVMTREEALRSYTRDNAWASFEETLKGTLAIGMLADFVVLDRDIMHVTDADLRDARVLQTVLGGKVVYTRK